MSTRFITAVWQDPYFTNKDKTKLLIALVIADCADAEDGIAWPGIEFLARRARSSTRMVLDICSEMQRDGKLVIERGAGPYGTSLYHLNLDPKPELFEDAFREEMTHGYVNVG